jgi:hypothetical protein
MQYMLLIAEPRGQRLERSPAQGHEAYDRMLRFADELKAQGRLAGVASLLSDDQGVRVQVRQGQQRAIDGPFSETKEMIGGYFLVECATREEAVALAARCPAAEWATVEVRPLGPCWA